MTPASGSVRRTSARRGRLLCLMLPLLSLALTIWACGARPITTHQPASNLRLTIAIMGQYGDGIDTQNVEVQAQLFESDHLRPVQPPPSAKMTCNGVNVTPAYDVVIRPCPRQPPGGVYIITYTDEHGVVTTATIPVPRGKLALLSPHAGSAVPIPISGAMDIMYEAPVAPQGGRVTLDELSLECGDWSVYNCGDQIFTLASADGPASATTNGGKQSFHMTGNFSQFRPGPGTILVTTTVHMSAERDGFDGVIVTFQDYIKVPITWTR